MIFIDDVVLVGKSREVLQGRLKLLMDTLNRNGLKISRFEKEYLEFRFGNDKGINGVSADVVRLESQENSDKADWEIYIFWFMNQVMQDDAGIVDHIESWMMWKNGWSLVCDKYVPAFMVKRNFYKIFSFMKIRSAVFCGTNSIEDWIK